MTTENAGKVAWHRNIEQPGEWFGTLEDRPDGTLIIIDEDPMGSGVIQARYWDDGDESEPASHTLWWHSPLTDESEPIDGSSDIPEAIGQRMWEYARVFDREQRAKGGA